MSEAQREATPNLEWDLVDRLVKSLRVAQISTADMAEHLHVHRNTVSNYLHGRTNPDYPTLNMWAQYTGVPLTWLLKGLAPDPKIEGHFVAGAGFEPATSGLRTSLRAVSGRAAGGVAVPWPTPRLTVVPAIPAIQTAEVAA